MSEFLFSQKYRPKRVADCILPDRLKNVFQEFVNTKSIPNLMLTGSAGVGKTSVAVAMCEELGINYLFINSSEERGIDTLRVKIRGYASTVSLAGGRKVIILDEADYITPEAQAALRGSMEEFSANCTFIFTCNFKARLIEALHSRCSVVDFTLSAEEKPKLALQFFKRVCDILEKENIQFDKAVLIKLVEKPRDKRVRFNNETKVTPDGADVTARGALAPSSAHALDDVRARFARGSVADGHGEVLRRVFIRWTPRLGRGLRAHGDVSKMGATNRRDTNRRLRVDGTKPPSSEKSSSICVGTRRLHNDDKAKPGDSL